MNASESPDRTSASAGPNEIEGTDTTDESWGDYPIDSVLIRTESRTVHDVLRRICDQTYVLDPDFQRDFIWPNDKQSKLIESVLMRIPLPVLYLAENDDGRMVVVDGLQRLSTFRDFVNGNLRLHLPGREELHAKRFLDLPPKLKNRIEDCNLILYLVDSNVPERARLDIFERVNGGVPLTRQQMRNCLYMGPATRFLKDESKTDLFLEATGNSIKTDKMRDREFINRFCAFRILGLKEYRTGMDDFLASVLTEMNGFSQEQLKDLSSALHRGLRNNLAVFGRHAFRKHEEGQERRSALNVSLWDAMSAGLSRFSEASVGEHATSLRRGLQVLLANERFNTAITYGTNHKRQVNHRFAATDQLFTEVLGAETD